ncbi:MAG: type IV secretion system DNA-binding domain-containing protein [Candidatus Competibacteraceae bacterium]
MAYHAYWMPWRPLYEGYALFGWLVGAMINLGLTWFSGLPAGIFEYAALACLVLAGWRAIPTWRLLRWRRHLRGRSVELLTLEQLQRRCARHPDAVWLGRGFEWRPEHAQRIHEIMARQRACPALPANATVGAIGASWLHGVGGRETDILLPLAHQAGHVLLVGTTRSFKTKQLLLLIAQAIFRGEAVIVIDPKGDRAVRQTMQAACRQIGKPEKFVFFHPAFPERSVRIDPLRHFNNFTEVASRIAALIPSETGSDPFKAFGWDALNNHYALLPVWKG